MTVVRAVTMAAEPDPGTEAAASRMREAMVDEVVARRELGAPIPPELEVTLRRVRRHVFLPGVPLNEAYASDAVVTKSDGRGIHVSAVSSPTIQATMLAQAGDLSGRRVLEIGSGGYNAALLAELVGPEGSVTTMDIDAEIVDRARICLDRAGYHHVRTACADGEFGFPDGAPYDVIMVTAGAWDIPWALVDQLVDGGVLVVPLRMRGVTRSWALARSGARLVSRSQFMCGFVPMQGVGGHQGRSVLIHDGGVSLRLDELRTPSVAGLAGALDRPRAEVWSGVTVSRGELFADQDLWLLAHPQFCVLTTKPEAVDHGIVNPSWQLGTPALIEGESIAYRARHRALDEARTVFEFGAYGHGPNGALLAEQLTEQIRTWDRDHRHGPGPCLTVYPSGTPDRELRDGFVLDKRHTRLVLSWADGGEDS